jgi:hypothetical protein
LHRRCQFYIIAGEVHAELTQFINKAYDTTSLCFDISKKGFKFLFKLTSYASPGEQSSKVK